MIAFFKKIYEALIEAQELRVKMFMQNRHWPTGE